MLGRGRAARLGMFTSVAQKQDVAIEAYENGDTNYSKDLFD